MANDYICIRIKSHLVLAHTWAVCLFRGKGNLKKRKKMKKKLQNLQTMKRAMSSNAKSAYNTKDKRKKYAIDQFGSDYWISDKVVLSTNQTEKSNIYWIHDSFQFLFFYLHFNRKDFRWQWLCDCWFLFRWRLENGLCIWLAHLFYVCWNAVICWYCRYSDITAIQPSGRYVLQLERERDFLYHFYVNS